MRRASHQRIVSPRTTPSSPVNSQRGAAIAPLEYQNGSTAAVDSLAVDRQDSSLERFADSHQPAEGEEPRQHLAIVIQQRIESRLPGRVRNLSVRVYGDTVLLEGQCATYYSKQIAQHAAMGVLENEHLENAIVVAVAHR